MADSTYEPKPVTLDGFVADRQRMWSGFTKATVIGIIVVIAVLVFVGFVSGTL